MLKPRKMSSPGGDSPSDLPFFHYVSERDRLNRHSATKRTTVLSSLPERCPYRAKSSSKNSKKLELGWLEFHSPEPPDPDVARPGDVWIQIPLDFDPTARSSDLDPASVCRLFVCYSVEGRQWTEWEGDQRLHSNGPPVGVHPLASPAMWGGTTERDAQFYLAFTGSDFTWVTGTRLAAIAGQWRLGRLHGDWMKRLVAKHSIDGIPFLPPSEAIAAWAERKTLTVSGVQVKKKDRKRISSEPTPERPSIKRRKPENEPSSPGVVAQDWRPALASEPGTKSYPYSFVSWPTVPHWTVMRPSFPPPSTLPSSDASDEPMDSPRTPPSSNFVLRPATFALSPSPANESLPSDDPPPTPPSPVPRLQPPQSEGRPRPPPTMYPHVSFTPTLSPPRYGERPRKRVIPSTCAQPASAGPSASTSSASAPPSLSVDLFTTSALMTDSVTAPLVSSGLRAPVGAMDAAPSVRGKYAYSGAVQRGWSLYIGETELLMPFPCDKCKRAGAICSGLEGQRCGRCRAIRKPCSHNAQPRPSRYKSDPPLRARFAVPVESSIFVNGPGAGSAHGPEKDERPEEPNGRPETKKMMRSNVHETSNAPLPQTPSSRASNDSLAESQDEDDNVVEKLMDREAGEEENVGVETVCFADAQLVGSQSPVDFVISQDAIPDHTFTRHNDSTQDSPHGDVHVDTPIASVYKVADVDNSTRAPTTIVESLDCQGGTGNETLPQSGEEGPQGSNIPSINSCASDPLEERRHYNSTGRWNTLTMHTDDGPFADPAGEPAPDCSQEVCMRAADGAAAGGGLPSPPRFVPVTGVESGGSPEGDNMDPRTGCKENGDASPLSTPPQGRTSIFQPPPSPKVADGEPRTSMDEEIVRFMEITLNGMTQVQDGLRGVFAIQKRRRVVQKRRMAVGNKYNK